MKRKLIATLLTFVVAILTTVHFAAAQSQRGTLYNARGKITIVAATTGTVAAPDAGLFIVIGAPYMVKVTSETAFCDFANACSQTAANGVKYYVAVPERVIATGSSWCCWSAGGTASVDLVPAN